MVIAFWLGVACWVGLSYGLSRIASIPLSIAILIVAFPLTWILVFAVADQIWKLVGHVEQSIESLRDQLVAGDDAEED